MQGVVIGLFVVFGIGVFGPGLFEYEALAEATPVVLWAVVITGLEVMLMGVLGSLATSTPAHRPTPDPTSPRRPRGRQAKTRRHSRVDRP